MKPTFLFAIFSCCILIVACKSQSGTSENNKPDSNASNVTHPIQGNTDSQVATTDIEKPKPEGYDKNISLPQNLTNFSFDFYKFLSEESKGKNLCFSPVSMNIALAMVYEGARNNTLEQMSQTMHLPDNQELFSNEFASYLRSIELLAKDSAVEFNLANRVFVESSFPILESYRSAIKQAFNGAFEQMDFINKFAESEQYINKWVEKMTKDRIKELLPAGTLSSETKLVLVNAIYIKARWKYIFDEKATMKKDFHINGSNIVQTDFMIRKQKGIRYYTNNDICAIELPYTCDGISLIIIKPHKGSSENLSSFIPTGSDYEKMLSDMKYHTVHMEIPKFKTETSFSLSDPLVAKGMSDAFSPRADFSGITGNNDLSVSEVLQKVFFEVDEKGSEAAAASAVVMRATSAAPNHEMEEIMYFIANQPFIYILKENNSDTPLFIGQYISPQ